MRKSPDATGIRQRRGFSVSCGRLRIAVTGRSMPGTGHDGRTQVRCTARDDGNGLLVMVPDDGRGKQQEHCQQLDQDQTGQPLTGALTAQYDGHRLALAEAVGRRCVPPVLS
jgi:hypothetical protein